MTQPWNTPQGTTNEQINGAEMVECPNPDCDDGKLCDPNTGEDYDCPHCNGTGQIRKEKHEH